ncbi:Proline--tRNA ligase [Buchnera aphidicola (Tetraneura ulmi)]|uniref:proline--tRNA ligase n=1 Tax=Buchnera aphidicola TaxID=9 RepID=UPI003463DB75
MKTKNYYLFTMKQINKNSKISISHKLMLKAGLIRQLSSGTYTWLPMGVKVIKKIKNIIRTELNNIGGIEIYMPTIQSSEIWKQSGRRETYGKELFKLIDRKKKEFVLAPTHEEVVTSLIAQEIHSYKQLPLILYQIQNKYRDEIRAKAGVVRSREFIMKDAYSFHENSTSLKNTYEKMIYTYTNIFKKMKLKFNLIKANSNHIGGDISHEFQTNTKKKITKKNIKYEIIDDNPIEIAHIFQIKKKYTSIFNTKIQNKSGIKKIITMGCYGIGITRLVSAIIQQHHDEKGIIWPNTLSPFQIAIIPVNLYKSKIVNNISIEIYKILKKNKFDVLFDNRKERTGVIFNEMDLIGIPHQIIVSEKLSKKKEIEYRDRKKHVSEILKKNNIINFITKKIKE